MFEAFLSGSMAVLAFICAGLIIASPLIALFCIIAEIIFGNMK